MEIRSDMSDSDLSTPYGTGLNTPSFLRSEERSLAFVLIEPYYFTCWDNMGIRALWAPKEKRGALWTVWPRQEFCSLLYWISGMCFNRCYLKLLIWTWNYSSWWICFLSDWCCSFLCSSILLCLSLYRCIYLSTLPMLVVYATDPIGATYAVDAGAIDGSTVAGSGFGSVSATFASYATGSR